jgi:hypothetical protein
MLSTVATGRCLHQKNDGKKKILKINLMKINRLAFGFISIDGKSYEKDVIIDNGTVKKRKKGPSKKYRGMFGHTPLSSGENIPWNCKFLVIGDGHSSSLPVMDEVYEDACEKDVKLLVMSTPEGTDEITVGKLIVRN